MAQVTQGALDLANPQTAIQRKEDSAQGFAVMLRSKISSILTGKKADDFVTGLITLMNQDSALCTCQPMSLITAALQAQSLNLSLNKNLGQAWIIPFNDTKNSRVMATFQIGYKGYLQLAIRSGYYKKINVISIKEGELRRHDPLTDDIDVVLIEDPLRREEAPTAGYYAMFEHLNGFRKSLYWTKSKMVIHADRYSPAFHMNGGSFTGKGGRSYTRISFADFQAGKVRQADMWMYSSFWYKDFDSMAYKTMLRQLLSHWGALSPEMQQAYENDARIAEIDGGFGEFADEEVNDDAIEGKISPATTICPNSNKTVSADECAGKDCRDGCPAWA